MNVTLTIKVMKEITMFIPSPGRIVEYTLSEQDAQQINRRRVAGAIGNAGFELHVGNEVSAGDTYPLVITRAWGKTEDSSVNGQVLLDGNDTLWVTSVAQGDGERKFREFLQV